MTQGLVKLLKKCLFAFVCVFISFNVYASNSDSESPKPISTPPNGFWETLWGEPGMDAVYLGLWTMHLRLSTSHDANWKNNMLGISYKGFFGGTFENSFFDRSYSFGIQRKFYQPPSKSNFRTSFGYRLGGIYGYDERLTSLAGQTPIVPLFQVIYDLSWKWFGAELSYVWVIVSVGFFVRYDF